LARDDIADIMVNGANRVFIEVGGKVQLTNIRFRDNAQLMNICQPHRQPGRPPRGRNPHPSATPACSMAPVSTSSRRRFRWMAPRSPSEIQKDKLTLETLVKFGSISPDAARVLQVIGRCRCNVLISGGTGSGKTTLLNCMTAYIDAEERVITCRTPPKLQLQQPHVVRLELARRTWKARARSPCAIW